WEFRRTFLEGLTRPGPDTVALARQWTQFVEEAGKEGAVQRPRAAQVVRLLVEFFRAALRFNLGGTAELADQEDVRFLEALGECVNADQILELLDHCLESDFQIDRRAQLVLILEALVDAMGRTVASASPSAN